MKCTLSGAARLMRPAICWAAFVLAFGAAASARSATFTVRKDGVILKDNQPFFPVGFFARSQDQATLMKDLTTILDAGFNTVKVGIFAANDLGEILDEVAKRKAVAVLEADSRNPSSSTLLPLVARAKSHPAVMGYYIMDDAHDYVTPQELKKKHDDVKAADPARLTLMADYDSSAFGPWLGITDVSGPYRYPVKTATAPLELVDRTYAEARKCNCSLIAIPQAFRWSGNRLPNAKEERNMVYQALANNVKGVLFYTFNGEGYVTDSPELWDEIKRLGPELAAMGDVITSGSYAYATANVRGVVAAHWKVGRAYVAVVVNTQNAAQRDVVVDLPNDVEGPLNPLFVGRPSGMSWSAGALRGSMQALDVHVYRIGLPPETKPDGGATAGIDGGQPNGATPDAGATPEDDNGHGGAGGAPMANSGGTKGRDDGEPAMEDERDDDASRRRSGCSYASALTGGSALPHLCPVLVLLGAALARRRRQATAARRVRCGEAIVARGR